MTNSWHVVICQHACRYHASLWPQDLMPNWIAALLLFVVHWVKLTEFIYLELRNIHKVLKTLPNNTLKQKLIINLFVLGFSGDGLAPSNEANHAENAAALYTAGPSPEKLLRELQQQLTRLFSAKPAEKFPLMMGACIKYLNINKMALTYFIFLNHRWGRRSGFCTYGMDF